MNICFMIGKIISNIEFKFIINSKNTSVAIFEIELSNDSIITVIVCIQGELNNKMEIIINEVENIY